MTYIKKALLGALILGTQTVALHGSHCIIDTNVGQSLPKEYNGDIQVSIFGATPRYSFYRMCMALLEKHLRELDQAYAKNTKLKGVHGRIKKVIKEIKLVHPAESLSEHFQKLSPEERYELFFKIGFHQETLKQNITMLCGCAQENFIPQVKRHLMIHLLLPIYFDDCAELKPTDEELYAYLKASARFYQKSYQEVKNAPDTIIYIPPLASFRRVLETSQTGTLDPETKCAFLSACLYDELFSHITGADPLVLINQNTDQSKAVGKHLKEQKGVPNTRKKLVELQLMQGLKRTKSFTPYIMKLNETQTSRLAYKTSPLVTDTLRDYFLRGDL